MSKKMMVNATHEEENRVAIVEDGILTELDIEVAGREPSKGNIYKAVVVRVETGLQAAFVDYGAERLGFLQIDEINYKTVKPDYDENGEDGRRPRINDLLQRGQEILVQITKEERGTKGAALTTYLSLAGRYMVLMPGSQTRGVSRKAESDAQRKELKKAMSSLDLAEGIGYIVRTAALDQTREELERDYRYLLRLYESIKELAQKSKAPALIYKESNLMIRSIRDYFTTDMDEVLIDDPQVFKEARDFFQLVMPDHVGLVKLHQERRPIFSRYQIEDQIETLNHNKVTLPSGGSIVIDPTEALVAIDVNSGKMASEKGVEATATKTNLEAATEVGRQLRLRDLGGLIVIDFIDMRDRKNMRLVENQVKKSLEKDKARVNVGRISKFGLLELSRQRIKAALTQGSHLPCPHCNGTGQLKSPETQAVSLLRKIHASAAKGQVSRVDAQLPMEVASYLLNNSREELVEMERRYQLQIHIHGNRDFLADQVEIEIQKKEKSKDKPAQQEFVAAANMPMVVAEEAKKEEAQPAPPAQAAQQEQVEGEPEQTKKRRRRRRRKSPGAATAEENLAGSEATESDPVDAQEEEAAAEQDEAAGETATEQAVSAAPTKRPQRRRRSGNRNKSAASEASPTEVSAELPATEPAAEATTAAAAAEEPAGKEQGAAEQKPKRRRSRRKPKPAEGSASLAEPASSETRADAQPAATPAPVQPVAAQAPAQPAAAAAPPKEEKAAAAPAAKPKRPRRPAQKPQTTEAVVAEAQQGAAAPPEQAVSKVSATTKEAAGAKAHPSPAAEPTAEKPKRRSPARTTAQKKAADTVKGAEAALVGEAQPVTEAPARKAPARRTRKAPAKESKVAAQSGESAPAAVKGAEGTAEEVAKPKRSRAVKKKPVEAAPESEA